jgi:hypothetical protein
MQNDDISHKLLGEIRDLLIENRNRYNEYLTRLEKMEKDRGKLVLRNWVLTGLVIFFTVFFALQLDSFIESQT